MSELIKKLENMITQLQVLQDSSFNVDKKAIEHQLIAYKNVLKIIQGGGYGSSKG